MSTARGLKVIKNSVNKNTEYKSVRTSADRVLISLLAPAPCFAAIVAGVFLHFFSPYCDARYYVTISFLEYAQCAADVYKHTMNI